MLGSRHDERLQEEQAMSRIGCKDLDSQDKQVMDKTNTNKNAIEALRTFAAAHNELAFADLCATALKGERWAIERIGSAVIDFIADTEWCAKNSHYCGNTLI